MKTKFIAFLSIAYVLSGCQPKSDPVASYRLSNPDKVKIAKEVLENETLSALYLATYAKYDIPNPTLSKPYEKELDLKYCTGEPEKWDVAIKKIKEFSIRFRGSRDPAYVEFKYNCLRELITSDKRFDDDTKIRAYFSVDDDNKDGIYERSIVFVPAKKEKYSDVYTDTPFKIAGEPYAFDLGSPCPPGCGTARPTFIIPGDSSGAVMALEAYENLPCCLMKPTCLSPCK